MKETDLLCKKKKQIQFSSVLNIKLNILLSVYSLPMIFFFTKQLTIKEKHLQNRLGTKMIKTD